MIALLRGRVSSTIDDQVVIDTGGVGYLVMCPARTLQRLPPVGGEVELRIQTQVREDSITLYGFSESSEQQWFRLLQGIQGVGARSALALLSVLSPEEMTLAIGAQDKAPLTRASGVGPKLAGRIVLELKDKIGELPSGPAAEPSQQTKVSPQTSDDNDALIALVNLGYSRSEVFAALTRLRDRLEDERDTAVLIREALRELSS